MNRRGFIGSAAGSTMSLLAAAQVKPPESGKTIAEKPRQTPVVREVDVVIAGGGPTAVGAALAAASEGMKVLVLERHGMLGSVWTAGLLNPFFDPDKGWLVAELIGRMRKAGAWNDSKPMPGGQLAPVFDVEVMKYALECMMAERGVEFWYNALVTDAVMKGDRVLGAIVESKSGREAVLGKVMIDCSGDGDLAARAGVPFTLGREKDGLAQPLTLMFEIDNIKSFGKLKAAELTIHEMYLALRQAIEDHHLPIKLPYGPQRSGAPYLIKVPRPGAAAIQATHMYKIDYTNTRDLTRATVEGRRQVHEIFMKAMKCIPGMEDVQLTVTAPAVGVRESRHLHGRYRLDLEDLLQSRRYKRTAVTDVNFPIDIHEIDPQSTAPKLVLPPGVKVPKSPVCDIPYGSLLPEHVTGLIFAGRCLLARTPPMPHTG